METPARRRKRGRVLAGTAIGIVSLALLAPAALGVSAAQVGLSMQAQAIRLAGPVLFPGDPTDPQAYRARVLKNQDAGPSLPSDGFRTQYGVTQTVDQGGTVITVTPRSSANPDLTVLYLHGGGYVADISFVYWDLIDRLVEQTGATVVVPLYALAPKATWQTGHALVLSVYRNLLDKVGPANIIIAGDSAGGGLALAAAQAIRDAGTPQAAGLVLFSPWLDATLSDPAQPGLDDADPMLSIHGLRYAAGWWAGDLPTSDPRISPLFGALTGLPPIALFTGTEDLLHPDATRLEANAERAGVPITVFTYPNEQHAWVVLFPAVVPEAQHAIDQASKFILDTAK